MEQYFTGNQCYLVEIMQNIKKPHPITKQSEMKQNQNGARGGRKKAPTPPTNKGQFHILKLLFFLPFN